MRFKNHPAFILFCLLGSFPRLSLAVYIPPTPLGCGDAFRYVIRPFVAPFGQVISERRGTQIGSGSPGKVYSYQLRLGDGREVEAVRKDLRDSGAVDLSAQRAALENGSAIYRLAAELGLGPEVLAVTERAGKSWGFFGKPVLTRQVYLTKQYGVTFHQAGWERNTLPERLESRQDGDWVEKGAKSWFGKYVFMQKAWAAMTPKEYEALKAKVDLLTRVHPDPSAENLIFVVRKQGDREVVDVIALDWENGSGGDVSATVEKLSALLRTRAAASASSGP